MCDSCGCVSPSDHSHTKTVDVHESLFAANEAIAKTNREHFEKMGAVAINLISSPGSGKTTLLEHTIEALAGELRIGVIEGDIETERDADRIRAKGVPVIQLTTGGACHLDASMTHKGFHQLQKEPGGKELDILFIENVGNLVCPASFDLGQHLDIVLLSVTEGDDKPAKYPVMFRTADLLVISKLDLLPYVGDFRIDRAENFLRDLASSAPIISLSARSGVGLDEWLAWVHAQKAKSSVDGAMAVENGGTG